MNEALKKNQVYKELRDHIYRGELKPGEKLPGESQLSAKLQVSRVTLRAALDLLEEAKLVERVDRKGTFVSREVGAKSFLAISASNISVSNPYTYIIPGIEKRLNEAGHRLEVCSPQFIRGFDPESFKLLLNRNSVHGIFLLESNFVGEEPELELLKEAGFPTVSPHGVVEDRPYFDFPMLTPDYRQAFADGVRHLASLGHHCIGTVSCLMEDGQNICRGFSKEEYLEFLGYNGLENSPSLFQGVLYEQEAVRQAVRRMMLGPTPPTAIMCFSDFYAIYVYEALHELNIRIPEQVSVMGFCGYPGGQFMNPPLSTVDLMYECIGRSAAELMLHSSEWFGKGGKPITVFSPHKIASRESTFSLKEYEFCKLNTGV